MSLAAFFKASWKQFRTRVQNDEYFRNNEAPRAAATDDDWIVNSTKVRVGLAAEEARRYEPKSTRMSRRQSLMCTQESLFNDPTGVAFEYTDVLKAEHGERLRLLELLAGTPHEDVRCRLTSYSLSSAPKFHALSYTWGQEEPSLHIHINDDKVLKVTPNLRSALRHLRLRDTNLLLWVDAVCIDQNNLEEKGWQVSLMRSFYEKSFKTFIWIGPAWHGYIEALRSARILALAESAERCNDTTNAANDISWDEADKEYAKAILDPTLGEVWNTRLAEMIVKPWFTRIWVIQEAWLSGDSAELHCGFRSMAWRDFARAVSYAFGKGLIRRSHLSERFDAGASVLIPVEVFVDAENSAETLLNLLKLYRRRHAKLPVDKVFALLGLVKHVDWLGLEPNYTLPLEAVYHQTTMQILHNTTHLGVLGAVSVDPNRQFSLSWIADWRERTERVEPFARRQRIAQTASGASTSKVSFQDHNSTLLLSGHSIGNISDTAEVLYRNDSSYQLKLDAMDEQMRHYEEADVKGLHDNIQRFMHKLNLMKGGASTVLDAILDALHVVFRWEIFAGVTDRDSASSRIYWETLCAENYIDGDRDLTENQFRIWYDSLGDTRRIAKLSFAAKSKILMFGTHMRSIWKVASRFPEVLLMAVGRRMARVGNRLALVPPTAVPGDEVVLCEGGRVPLVVRRYGRYWKLVGECYVHGIMQGQAFKWEDCREMRFR